MTAWRQSGIDVAGIGKIVLAHAGNLRPDDLNRQILMAHDGIGKPRVDCAIRRLRELNPRIEIEAVNENVNESNIAALVGKADLIAANEYAGTVTMLTQVSGNSDLMPQ